MKKIAIFIAGPPRYVNDVRKQIERLFLGKYEFDFFYFLWKSDSGNKVRCSENSDFMGELIFSEKTKTFVVNSPYTMEDITRYTSKKHDGHSSINNVIGMFTSVSILCDVLRKLPDFGDYSHVFRVRTDCLFLEGSFIDSLILDDNVANVANNPYIPESWVSDHLMFSDVSTFFKVWSFSGLDDILSKFDKSGKNPERMLSFIMEEENIRIHKSFNRFLDYHIVYNPPKQDEPKSLINATLDSDGIKRLFEAPYSIVDRDEFYNHHKQWSSTEVLDPRDYVGRVSKKIKGMFK